MKTKTLHIAYVYKNRFCRYAMSQRLQAGGFKWVKTDSINKDIKKYDKNSGRSPFLKVDLNPLEHLGRLHKELHFIPEKMVLNKNEKL